MKVDVLCVGLIRGESLYTTKTFDPSLLPQRIRGMMQSRVSTRAQDIVFGCGGGGYIAALALSRLGFKVALSARVGHDSIGCEAVRKLATEKVNTTLIVQTPQAATSLTTLIRSPQDDSFEISYISPGGLDKKSLSRQTKVAADWLYVSGPFADIGELKVVLAQAKKQGMQSMVRLTQADVVQARRVVRIASNATVCIFEREDAELLTHQADIDASLFALRESGLKTVIVQDDVVSIHAIHDGFLYRTRGGRKATVVNATGITEVAGPSILAHLIHHGDFGAALDFGLVAARSVAGYIGSEAGLLSGFTHRTGKVDKKFL